ncbi:hypothetical protein FB45DRAFT_6712 [Roridomyces roridus]|uniref:Arrestin-like N-terminal domain-containing protein n=1 Tax=Roridomyces roridus TaxID=1738132 RepID=A0AAD7G1P3_9AGAR|nr:hypothetical protein FB45DRAFT_6712 [Roridomyces roridus]
MDNYVQRIARTLDSMDPSAPPPRRSRDLPVYNQPRQITNEHKFHLTSMGSKSPWATLKVLSRSSGSVPTFLQGDKITGSLTLDLERPDNITSIRAVAKGQIIPGLTDKEALTFMGVSSILWSKENDSEKLSGHYSWPFSLEMPSTVTLAATTPLHSATFQLPQSFLERRFPTSVQYVLVVHINRSRFRVNSRVQTQFAYVPLTRPSPPSPLRQLAYQRNSALPHPDVDPDGWEQLPPFPVRGIVFSTRKVEAICTLFLAKPLCYTRGSPIPCLISLSSPDAQALDLLSSPRAISVHLRRRLSPITPASQRSGMFDANADLSADPAENMALATWWPLQLQSPGTRRLEGEIQLPSALKPSSRMAHFGVEYSVDVLPFKAIAFAPVDEKPFLRQPVEVVTMFARDSPRPLTYAPPQYNEEERDAYFNADGLGHVWRT